MADRMKPRTSTVEFLLFSFFILSSICIYDCQARVVQSKEESGVTESRTSVADDSMIQNKAIPAPILQQVINEINRLQNNWNNQVIDRNTITCKIVDHFRSAFSSYNCMVVHSNHLASFEESTRQSITVPTSRTSKTTFDIYIFKRGHFTLLGDGGFINWCFGGNYQRDGGRVTFYDP